MLDNPLPKLHCMALQLNPTVVSTTLNSVSDFFLMKQQVSNLITKSRKLTNQSMRPYLYWKQLNIVAFNLLSIVDYTKIYISLIWSGAKASRNHQSLQGLHVHKKFRIINPHLWWRPGFKEHVFLNIIRLFCLLELFWRGYLQIN